DGKVSAEDDEVGARELAAPSALAFYEALEGSPLAVDIRAVDRAICLALGTEEFLTLLSDNTAIPQCVFRMLRARASARVWRGVQTAAEGTALLPAGVQ